MMEDSPRLGNERPWIGEVGPKSRTASYRPPFLAPSSKNAVGLMDTMDEDNS